MALAIPYFAALTTYLSYGLLFGYAPICRDYEDFYTRRLYGRIKDCWNRPISSAPDAWITVELRDKADNRTGEGRRCLNLGSYNYLGFAAQDEYCTSRVQKALQQYSAGTCGPRMDAGTTERHVELEKLVARFVGKPAAITFGMGFATNSAVIPALVGKGSLIISDSLNHASIRSGAAASGAKIKVFRHNVPADLERVLRQAVAEGQPRSHRPWKKILIVVEGVYSMEGECCCLPEIVELKKKYKAYLYLDEAHSIGCMGKTGRGVCEYFGVNPADVDIMMGTFTKSFGSCGGYIAGSEELIAYIRHACPASLYAESMSVPAVEQALSALQVIMGEDGTMRGTQKIQQLHENSNYFREQLRAMGCEVLGDEDSPIIPIMLYHPAKLPCFSRECLKRNLAVVVVGFPATPLLLARARMCLSAAHSREDLDYALQVLDEIVELTRLKFNVPSLVEVKAIVQET
eukprot:jgi/Chlat1/7979/Chrsp7S00628